MRHVTGAVQHAVTGGRSSAPKKPATPHASMQPRLFSSPFTGLFVKMSLAHMWHSSRNVLLTAVQECCFKITYMSLLLFIFAANKVNALLGG